MGEPKHLLHVFSTFAAGGPQVRTAALLNRFGDRYRHTIVAMDGNTACRSRIEPHVPCEIAPLDLDPRSRLFPLRLGGWLREKQPDLLLTYNWGAIESVFAARWKRVAPILHHEEGFRPDEAAGSQKKRRVLTRRFLLRGAVRTVVVPSRLLERIAREVWRVKNVLYIPNAVDGERFRPGDEKELRASWGVGPDELVVGSIAHFTEVKDVGYLIDAFAAAKLGERARLVLAGDGPEEPDLRARVRTLGLEDRVVFLGRIADTARRSNAR